MPLKGLPHCFTVVREDHQGCLIQEVMTQAEQQMEDYLKERKLVELVDKNPGLSSMLNALDRSLT